MSPGLARYLAFSGNARSALSVSPCDAAIALRVSPTFTVTVTIGGRRSALARLMTRLALASRVAGGHGVAATRHAVDVSVHDHGAAVDRQAERPRCRRYQPGDALELGIGEGLGPCARALGRLVHPLVHVQASRPTRRQRRSWGSRSPRGSPCGCRSRPSALTCPPDARLDSDARDRADRHACGSPEEITLLRPRPARPIPAERRSR